MINVFIVVVILTLENFSYKEKILIIQLLQKGPLTWHNIKK